VRGGVCRFAAAFADAGVCAWAWAAVRDWPSRRAALARH
jgi:hypothetical protein